MTKILVILTGGTIGSSSDGRYISVNSDSKKYKIIEMYRKAFSDAAYDIKFDTCEPYTILSENLNGKYINKLIKCLNENLNKDYSGIIITHGTDTLQYTAAALGIIFSNISIPILMVSSNYILEDERANGLDNFSQAVSYIKSGKNPGIYVAYDKTIYSGLNLLPHMAYSDKLYQLEANSSSHDNLMHNIKHTLDNYTDFTGISLSDNSPVQYIRAVPGQIYPDLSETDAKAILMETYHSGTLSTDSKEFRDFCHRAKTFNIPIYIVGMEDRLQYESTSLYENLGLKTLEKISPVTAYMMLWIKYS